MATQTITLTALPRGLSQDKQHVQLSVFFSPRLVLAANEPQNLSPFPDFLQWPTVIQSLSFTVRLVDGANNQIATTAATVVNSNLDQALWRALFQANTFVRSHSFSDYSQHTLRSYPVRTVLNTFKQHYQALGRTVPNRVPVVSDIVGREQGNRLSDQARAALNELINTDLPQFAIPWDGQSDPSQFTPQFKTNNNYRPELVQFLQYHYQPYSPSFPLPKNVTDYEKLIDFHQAASSLGDYPAILRRLGLVVDLEVNVQALPAQTGTVFIQVAPQQSRPDFVSLSTALLWDGTQFATPPHPTGSSDLTTTGMVQLNNEQYDVVQVDIDGMAFKAMGFAVNLNDELTAQPRNRDRALKSTISLPSLRSAGISVVRVNRQERIRSALATALQHNQTLTNIVQANGQGAKTPPPQLYIDDVTRGYRVDIWDSRAKQWHSLCRRVGTYQFLQSVNGTNGGKTLTITDEGFVQMGATESQPDPNQAPNLHIHEAIFRWHGWSLVAPRPGKSLNKSSDPTSSPVTPDNQPLTPFQLITSFKPETHTLPLLRFGINYQVRARVVDLAGNSLSLDEANALTPIPDVPVSQTAFEYLRYEPVIAPAVVLRELPDTTAHPGESLAHLVIHSLNTSPSLDNVPSTERSERHIAPPKTSELLAETHGMFDDTNGKPRADRYHLIAQKDAGAFATQPFIDGTTPMQVPVEPAAQLTLPYLPDPLARGAALRNLPGTVATNKGQVNAQGHLVYQPQPLAENPAESVTLIDFGQPSVWPNMLPFRLVMVEGKGEPLWDATAHTLTVNIPKAESITVSLSSYINKDDLHLMGVWQWIRESIEQFVQAQMATLSDITIYSLQELNMLAAQMVQYALEGAHWMLTPYRTLTLTHAVKQPLGRPRFIDIVAVKQAMGQTYAVLQGSMHVHGKSTTKLDMLATWTEPDSTDPTGQNVIHASAHAAEVPIHLPGDIVSGPMNALYDAIAQQLRFNPSLSDAPQHHFGDTKYRRVSYQAVGTSRFREYFPPVADGLPPDDPNGITRASTQLVIDVPNSARPAAPNVLYIVPTFGWSRQEDTNIAVSQRIGGGLRVYMEPAWYSSGEGELLGVVLPQTDVFGLAPDEMKPYVTQWGQDPIWSSADTIKSAPYPTQFTQATAIDTEGLTVEELHDSTVTLNNQTIVNPTVAVAGHAVHFDEKRKLWYCDIELEAEGRNYFPFVRLALARYQPHSILLGKNQHVYMSTIDENGNVRILAVDEHGETHFADDSSTPYYFSRTNNLDQDACLSRVVLTDFAQIAPDRSLLITYDPYNPDRLNVVVAGMTYNKGYIDTFTNTGTDTSPDKRIEVTVEKRISGITDDALAWESDTISQVGVFNINSVDEMLWRGVVTLPAGRTPKQYRLVIKEYELFYAGRKPFTGIPQPILSPRVVQRLVYTDTYEV